MHFRINGKRAVRMAGCALFCLIVCVEAFWNRTLILGPVSEWLRGHYGFEDMKREVQENYLDDRFRGKNDLITLNGGFARLQERTHYNSVQLMKNGMLTSLNPEAADTADFAESLSRFSRYLDGLGIPFLFVMEPFKIPTEENLLPAGVTDKANETADQALAQLRERNVPVLDLREEMSRTEEMIRKNFYRTDHHWNAEGSFFAYQKIMEAIQKQFPDTKMSYTDRSLWEKTVVPHFWLGSDGRRVGPLYAGTDDLDYYLPAFETEMSRYSIGVWVCRGDFREANMREWLLEKSDYFNMDTYSRYLGGGYPLTLHRNAGAENPRKILILRDSFVLPVECFLSTELAAVDSLDPRRYEEMTETDYIAMNPPDMVLFMIYPEILTSQYFPYYFPEEGKSLEILGESEFGDVSVTGTSGNSDYQILPARLESGKSYVLTMEHIRAESGEPDGANIRLYHGENLEDETVLDIDYGNRYEHRWGFRIPDGAEDGEGYELRLYAGVDGATENVRLDYQGIRLREGVLKKP
ncbi:MAG: hypothetical protein J6J41_08550 [Clostridia bacterium]|nr:hypothetical protein [Clostridia bacterium]